MRLRIGTGKKIGPFWVSLSESFGGRRKGSSGGGCLYVFLLFFVFPFWLLAMIFKWLIIKPIMWIISLIKKNDAAEEFALDGDGNIVKKKFYQKTWFLVLMMLFFPYIALPLIWTVFKDKSKNTKIVLSVVAGLLSVIGLASLISGSSKKNSPANSVVTTIEESTSIETDATTESSEITTTVAVVESTTLETTETSEATTTTTEEIIVVESTTTETSIVEHDYVLNTSKKKIHKPTCSSVKKISDSNKKEVHGTLDEFLDQGYTACGNCHPK